MENDTLMNTQMKREKLANIEITPEDPREYCINRICRRYDIFKEKKIKQLMKDYFKGYPYSWHIYVSKFKS